MKFSNDIGLKKKVTLDDALSILQVWRGSKMPHMARYHYFSFSGVYVFVSVYERGNYFYFYIFSIFFSCLFFSFGLLVNRL